MQVEQPRSNCRGVALNCCYNREGGLKDKMIIQVILYIPKLNTDKILLTWAI